MGLNTRLRLESRKAITVHRVVGRAMEHAPRPSETGPRDDHAAHGTMRAGCPECMASMHRTKSAKIAWTVAAVAVLLLVGVFFYGASSRPGLALGAGGFALLAIIACPIMMGLMMWMMMRHHG